LADLSKKRERERLKIQRWPHYMKLSEGAYLGFRRGPDTWQARFRDRDGVQQYKALDEIGRDDYDGAKRAAEAWFSQMGSLAVRSIALQCATRSRRISMISSVTGAPMRRETRAAGSN
jgi:hypothetical protein